MSQANVDENIEVVLASYEWANRERKFPWLWWHEDGEYITAPEDPERATHRGIEAIGRLSASWLDVYPDLRMEPVEARARADRIFVWVRATATGTESGLAVDMEVAHVITLEDGKIRRLEVFMDRAEALEAVGLSE